MSLVAIKDKYQIVIPAKVRKAAGVEVGDFLEASFENEKLTFVPQTPLDREIVESIADFRAGRTSGPFETHEALVKHLKEVVRKYRTKKNS